MTSVEKKLPNGDSVVANPATIALPATNGTVTKSPQFKSISRPSPYEVLRRMLLLSDGRDKTMKVVQYFTKIVFWLYLSDNKSKYPTLHARGSALTSQFSTTRKIIRLFHFLEPYTDFREYVIGARFLNPKSPPYGKVAHYLGFVNSVAGMGNDILDDLYCLGKIGILSKETARRVEPIAIAVWFVTIWLDIHELLWNVWQLKKKMARAKGRCSEEECKKMEEKMFWLKHGLLKMLADLSFCGYDFFECTFSEGFQTITGFASGALSMCYCL
ncbi:8293_t:CDS:2 [Paraglomus brasilianum]|uniref:8293_t:CDS:1 n=1 Tax=Paraglomus brasilianum TaxID=144538 RepID=A0A9N9AWC8_9GLOM|nr:8293_t:CDS:2 [Paraglomus brasilianum]